jgi:hypothetical protein
MCKVKFHAAVLKTFFPLILILKCSLPTKFRLVSKIHELYVLINHNKHLLHLLFSVSECRFTLQGYYCTPVSKEWAKSRWPILKFNISCQETCEDILFDG